MNRLQQSGLIALGLLLAIAAVGSFLGRGKVTAASVEDSPVVLEPDGLGEEIDLYSRRERIGPEDFLRRPLPDPLDPDYGGPAMEPVVHSLDPEPVPSGPERTAHQPPPSTRSAAGRTVVVAPGDTLEAIAARELGDRSLWKLIATRNGIHDPRRVRAGDRLSLPGPDELADRRRALAEFDDAGPGPAAGAAAGTERRHRVAEGETISEISQRYYGTSRLWRHILAANGLSDPRQLRAGTTLVIPPPPR
ncbi:MAG: LysM domain-containing protein [Planctomycetota bacterium]|nr:MAG: LysM domain-containing protein [Planctomycetota bacterium]